MHTSAALKKKDKLGERERERENEHLRGTCPVLGGIPSSHGSGIIFLLTKDMAVQHSSPHPFSLARRLLPGDKMPHIPFSLVLVLELRLLPYCVKVLDQRLPVRSSGEQLTQCLDFHAHYRFGGGDNLI
ncbi:hypothetical protein QQF64_011411 [Cirrhinus molitorella]|uniref:Uncharacterized protein n=1 Tax=Cirrhinus molitorella TaxID=172907 RepID=A0ABR3LZ66_9TELE